jgi:hypothetical protein
MIGFPTAHQALEHTENMILVEDDKWLSDVLTKVATTILAAGEKQRYRCRLTLNGKTIGARPEKRIKMLQDFLTCAPNYYNVQMAKWGKSWDIDIDWSQKYALVTC